MLNLRKKYDCNFKLKVVELSYECFNISDLVKEFDMRVELFYCWCCEFFNCFEVSFSGNGKVG